VKLCVASIQLNATQTITDNQRTAQHLINYNKKITPVLSAFYKIEKPGNSEDMNRPLKL
jgi:hypothetical protein